MTYGAIFPGQGSQVAGMGRVLAAESAAASAVYAMASDVLALDLLRAGESRAQELSEPAIVQPAIVAYGLAALAAVREATGAAPQIAAGHSLGELAALCAAGALDPADTIALAKRRGELMGGCPPGVMAVVFGLPGHVVEEVCAEVQGVVGVANRNLKDQFVISGDKQGVQRASDALAAQRAVVRPLAISVAAHSPLMESAVGPFYEAVLSANVREPRIPVISSVLARPFRGVDDVVAGLTGALTACVDWPGAVAAIGGRQATPLVEMGPKAVLRDLTVALAPGQSAWSVGVDGLGVILGELGSGSSSGVDSRAAIAAYLRVVIGTPTSAELDGPGMRLVREKYAELRSMLEVDSSADRGFSLAVELMSLKGHDEAATRKYVAAATRSAR